VGAHWRLESCKLFRSGFQMLARHLSWARQPINFLEF